MLPPKSGNQLEFLSESDKVLGVASPSNYYTGYLPLPPGSYSFAARYPNAKDVIASKHFPTVMRDDVYVTLLAYEKDGKPTVELIDDTYDASKTPDGKLTVRSFFPGAQVSILVDNHFSSGDVSNGETRVIDGLPLKVLMVAMRGTGAPGTPPMLASTELDFTIAKRATVVVIADQYGRFRPRIAVDGKVTSGTSPRSR